MAYLVVLVLDDIDQCPPILEAWEEAGVRGITILESSGIGRVRRATMRDDLPLMPSLLNLMRSNESHHRTLFSVVETQERVEALVQAAQSVVGDFSEPHTGVLFVVELYQVYGLNKRGKHNP
jgi:nitrogen regulatory protein PII